MLAKTRLADLENPDDILRFLPVRRICLQPSQHTFHQRGQRGKASRRFFDGHFRQVREGPGRIWCGRRRGSMGSFSGKASRGGGPSQRQGFFSSCPELDFRKCAFLQYEHCKNLRWSHIPVAECTQQQCFSMGTRNCGDIFGVASRSGTEIVTVEHRPADCGIGLESSEVRRSNPEAWQHKKDRVWGDVQQVLQRPYSSSVANSSLFSLIKRQGTEVLFQMRRGTSEARRRTGFCQRP